MYVLIRLVMYYNYTCYYKVSFEIVSVKNVAYSSLRHTSGQVTAA